MVFDLNNGIYRGAIAALVGLTLIGAAELPKKDAQPEQAKEQREIADSLKDIAASLKEAQKPDQTTQPCDPKKPNRNSDLCAQWKAADAAADAAEAAWRQILIGWIGVALGSITMVAAIAAAKFAKKAAEASEENVSAAIDAVLATNKANEISIFAQRPWISIDATPTIMTTKANSHTWEYLISFKNLGSTVAKNFSFEDEIVFILPDSLDTKEAQWEKWKTPVHKTKSVIMPGDVRNAPGSRTFKDDSISWLSMGTVKPREVMPVIVVSAFYQGSDDNVWHRTDQAFRIGMGGEYYVGTALNESIVELRPPELIGISYGATLAT